MRGTSRDGPARRALRELARRHGIQTAFLEMGGRRRVASDDSLAGALEALGVAVDGPGGAVRALREDSDHRDRRALPPVLVAWNGLLRLPAPPAGRSHGTVQLTLESGRPHPLEPRPRPTRVPFGYHRLSAGPGRAADECLVIAAPRRCPEPAGRSWGTFLPLYALRTGRDWGVGDLTDLGDLLEWVAGLGGTVAATLPLLASFLGEPFEPSPYSPASRLFWNELYADVSGAPEVASSQAARARAASSPARRERRALRRSDLVDYRRVAGAKRRVMEAGAESFFAAGPSHPGRASFRAFLRSNPDARRYASFMATSDRLGRPWTAWPGRERDGRLRPEGGHTTAYRYHLYAQWLMERQMGALSGRASASGVRLMFDIPLGVNPGGYDVWRERELFALGASVGAPPDPFFAGGQNWGFPPPHPERLRQQGYRYPIACLRHLLRHAGAVRIDHVMGLHRLFWVPRGLGARDGVYVRYRSEELYAIVALEAHRSGAIVVGEDLGTVPREVRLAMARHGLLRSHVLQLEARPGRRPPLPRPPGDSLASLNTHDLPTFASFWRGEDIGDPARWGPPSPDAAAAVGAERARREALRSAVVEQLRREGLVTAGRPSPQAAARGALLHLARSSAAMVVANLEDLWLETLPQNVPGTWGEGPNWRRRARHSLEEIRKMPAVLGTLKGMDRARRKGRAR